jgi:hypothetical protein
MRLRALYFVYWTILICSSVVTCGRTLLTEQGRSLHQSTACDAITNCEQCFTTKDEEAVTMLACRTCASGYRPSSDLTACGKTYAQHIRAALLFTIVNDAHHAECAPGYHFTGGNCTICPKGSYCLGGSEPARVCAERGLTTLTKGVRSPTSCGKYTLHSDLSLFRPAKLLGVLFSLMWLSRTAPAWQHNNIRLDTIKP